MRLVFLKFRTLNHKSPVQTGRFAGIPRHERYCTKCGKEDLGDEFHYVLVCDFFSEDRKKSIPKYFYRNPNVLKFKELMTTTNTVLLLRLIKFVVIICQNMT